MTEAQQIAAWLRGEAEQCDMNGSGYEQASPAHQMAYAVDCAQKAILLSAAAAIERGEWKETNDA